MTPGDRRPWLPVALLLLQVPGCSSLSGPTSVTGTVGGSLSVQCQYEEKFRDIAKYWCKSPCLGDIVKIEKSDKEVRNGRVSIRNHPANLTFTVTLENLTEGDAGTYRCGIDTSWLPGYLLDVTFHVVVSVTPGLHRTLPAPTWSTTTLQESPNSGQHPGLLPEGHAVEDQASKGVERSLLSRTYFRLLVFLEVPLLLSMLSAVL